MDVILYNAEDGKVQLEVHLEKDTVWLTQDQMADLFGRERSVITKHVRNVFKEGELPRKGTTEESSAVRRWVPLSSTHSTSYAHSVRKRIKARDFIQVHQFVQNLHRLPGGAHFRGNHESEIGIGQCLYTVATIVACRRHGRMGAAKRNPSPFYSA